MPRRFLFLVAALLCTSPMVANAQFQGGSSTTQSTDCSNAANASSPECTGTAPNPYSTEPQYGTGQGAYGAGGQQQPSAMGGNGIRQNIPTYNDRFPNENQFPGAYPNPYSPYAGFRPKQPLTDFQRVVAGSVGAVLPIFGANLFSSNAAQFAPVDRTPVTADYMVGPGDELLIRVWGQVNFNVHATVDRAGDVYIPQVGNIEVAGLHFQQLNDYLKTQLGRVFRNFDLSVNMGQLRSIQIYVVGNARQPGSYTVSSLSTLVNALFASGGPSEQGSMRRIELRRDGKVVTTVDLYDLLIDGDKSHDAPLLPGDVIYIPPMGPQVAIAGSVHVPAIYELKGTETAGQTIALAGGLSTMASKQEVQLDRTNQTGVRQTVQIALDTAGMDTPLRDGDILRIPAMVQQFERTVILRGNVANPGRYRWKPEMRILDLIPDKDSLQTRGYWQRRIALGLPAPEYTPLFSAYHANLPSPFQENTRTNSSGQQQIESRYTTGTSLAGNEREESNQGSQYNEQPQGQTGQTVHSNSSTNNTTQNTASNPNQSSNNGYGQPNNNFNGSNFNGSSQNRLENNILNQENSRKYTTPSLRYFPPGDRFSQGQFPIKNEILRTAPSIDWSYAAIERTDPHTLATTLIPFNLGKAVLDHDPSENPELKPGDVITVFSTADIQVPQAQRVKYVSLQGEIIHAGIYSVEPGETLRDLVARAGGLTPKAYLYGSEFLRESTQRLQQARLDEYANAMERDMQVSSSNASGSLVNATGAAALASSLQSQRNLVMTLRKIRATGRIVLNLNPYSHGIDALPNLPLEDGDQFVVPVVPATVNVVGAVYDQNSFLYRRGDRVQDYLKVAGGTTRNADKRHEFVIRADGSVLSKETAGGTMFTDEFGNKYAYPGDTLVVPDNMNKTTLLRGLTDWSTVFSQFGLGIAALTVLAGGL